MVDGGQWFNLLVPDFQQKLQAYLWQGQKERISQFRRLAFQSILVLCVHKRELVRG